MRPLRPPGFRPSADRSGGSLPGLKRAVCAAALPWIAGCSVQHLVVNRVGDSLAAGDTVYAADDDPDLIGAATPFGLKLTESLLAESPEHRGLLLAAARGYTQYAYAFVELPADETELHDVAAARTARERARRLYLRARDYGLRGLTSAHAAFSGRLPTDPEGALAEADRDDVALLYWTAAAWGAAISVGKNEPALLADLPAVQRMADRALELDESFGNGSLHLLQLNLVMSQPRPQVQRIAAARRHFDRALVLTRGRQAAPFVTYAEAVAIPAGREDEFDAMLVRALAVDPDAAPDVRLANRIYQRRARWLQAHAEQFFVR
jgi:predicted anti-sigma-YlaC factor YlaD